MKSSLAFIEKIESEFLEMCIKIEGPQCIQTQIDIVYTPSCSSAVASAEARN